MLVSRPERSLPRVHHTIPCDWALQPNAIAIVPGTIENIRNKRMSFDFDSHFMASSYRRLMQEATQAAPKPLSMLTTVTLEPQELSMPSSAATPPKLAP